ncbi:MAG: ABC transporter ATP-binding protein [Egibacteraceae bacterium]
MSPPPVLRIARLDVRYRGGAWAARDIDLVAGGGEVLALVGESGCGKTTIIKAVLGLLPPGATVTGSIRISGAEMVGAPGRVLRRLRGPLVGYVGQNPFAACDPLRTVGHHVAEAWTAHRLRPPAGEVPARLGALGIPDPVARARLHPHQWSGGMLQRAATAAAQAHEPSLIVADEPTSALDAELAGVTLRSLRRRGAGVLLATHDLGLVREYADELAILYAGRVVECGPVATVLARPRHPYTAALLAAVPRPGAGLPTPLPGAPPGPRTVSPGCAFADRCPAVFDRCHRERPGMEAGVACHAAEP